MAAVMQTCESPHLMQSRPSTVKRMTASRTSCHFKLGDVARATYAVASSCTAWLVSTSYLICLDLTPLNANVASSFRMSTKSTTTSKARGYNKQHPRRKRVSRIDWFFSLPIPTSFTHFLACVLFSSHALAYRNVQLHHPGNITSCVPVNITWHSGTPPFWLEIIPEYPLSWDVPKTHRDGLHVDHLVENFYLWPPNFPRAWRVRIRVSDRTSTSAMVRGNILENSTGGCTNIVAPPNTTTSIETVTSTLTVSTSTLMLTSTRIGDTSPNGKWKTSMTIAIGAVGMVALSTLLLIFFRCRYLRRHAHDRAHGSGSCCPSDMDVRR